MLQVFKTLVIDLAKNNIVLPIRVKQCDKNSWGLRIVYLYNGKSYTLPDGVSAIITVKRPNENTPQSYVGELLDLEAKNIVKFVLNAWMLEIEGVANCEIKLIHENSTLTSLSCKLLIEKSFNVNEITENDDRKDFLQEIIEGYQTAQQDANTAINNAQIATEQANTALDNANTAISNANSAVETMQDYTAPENFDDRADSYVGRNGVYVANIVTPQVAANIIQDSGTPHNSTAWSALKTSLEFESRDTQAEAMSNDISTLKEQVNNLYGMAELDKTVPGNIQKIVRMGLANVVFKVGEQFTCEHYGWGDLTWDIIAINFDPTGEDDNPKNLWLQLHSTLDENLPFDVAEPDNPDTNIATYGYNRWSKSNIRQWLNSDQDGGEWWQAQHEYDAPPTYADDYAGFLMELDPDFLNIVRPVTVKTALSDADGGGYEETTDRFFLPSQGEVFGGVEGESQFPYYQNLSDKSKRSSSNTNGLWRLRNPNLSNTYQTGSVYYGGSYFGNTNASMSLGIAPVCCIY